MDPAAGDAGRLPDRLERLYPQYRHPAPLRRPVPAAPRLPIQQMVFRRGLQRDLRPPRARARPLLLEEGRRRHDRSLRPQRRSGRGQGRQRPHLPAPVRLSLHLRPRHAPRPRRRRHLDDGAMNGLPILSIGLAVPVLAGILCLFVSASAARWLALGATLLDLALGILLWQNYQIGGPQWQFVEYAPVFGAFSWALGIDGIALMLIMLSVFLMPICILASWSSIEKRVPEYMACFLLMETMMLGVFMAQDIFLFYLFFEAGLIPMFLIIGIWGGAQRIYASYKFFLYTLFGSLLMLVAMMWMVNFAHTTYIPTLLATDFPPEAQTWLWLAFFASFAVKMPMWPVHTWLPDAHVQAPTAGSVILAG